MNTNEGFLVYVNADEEGNIIESLAGFRTIPQKQYDHFFYLENVIDLLDYKIKYEGHKAELIRKEVL